MKVAYLQGSTVLKLKRKDISRGISKNNETSSCSIYELKCNNAPKMQSSKMK